MRRSKRLFLTLVAAVLGLVAILLVLPRTAPSKAPPYPAKTTNPQIPAPPPLASAAAVETSEIGTPASPKEAAPKLPQAKGTPLGNVTSPGAGQQPVDQDPPTTDELARFALAFVGFDPWAEEYWEEAINDATVPSEERRNLIEDLNEDGLSDPRRPGEQDLPLIVSRLALIEQIAPAAMDQINAEAFAEAHKDLRQMFQRLTGQTWPALQ